MSNVDAVKLINKVRLSNSFTMGLTFDEYVVQFKQRWYIMNKETLHSNTEIAMAIQSLL